VRELYQYEDLLSYEEPARPFLIKHLLHPGSKMLMGGTAKRGKSFILHGILYALATGTPLFGNEFLHVPAEFPGILFSQELGPQELKRRWKKYEGLPTTPALARNLVVCPKNLDYRLDRDEGITAMREQVYQAAQALGAPVAWIALDPISKLHHANENDQREVGLVMRNIERLQAFAQGAAIIIVHHFGHPNEMSPYRQGGGRFRGSTHFYADVDTLVTLQRNSPLWAKEPKFTVAFETRHGEPLDSGWIQLVSAGADRCQPVWVGAVPNPGNVPGDPEYGEVEVKENK
jgi:RecA-family ATPase